MEHDILKYKHKLWQTWENHNYHLLSPRPSERYPNSQHPDRWNAHGDCEAQVWNFRPATAGKKHKKIRSTIKRHLQRFHGVQGSSLPHALEEAYSKNPAEHRGQVPSPVLGLPPVPGLEIIHGFRCNFEDRQTQSKPSESGSGTAGAGGEVISTHISEESSYPFFCIWIIIRRWLILKDCSFLYKGNQWVYQEMLSSNRTFFFTEKDFEAQRSFDHNRPTQPGLMPIRNPSLFREMEQEALQIHIEWHANYFHLWENRVAS